MVTNTKEYNKKNYKKYWGSKEAIADRAQRNAARSIMEKKGLVHKGDGKDVDHRYGTKGGNGTGNLRVLLAEKNRRLGQKKAMGPGRKSFYDVSN
jgi:hypothetical protein